jgi:organic radical activating enzyme
MKLPIKIVSRKKLKVLWQITTACTYTCSYCPKELHTGRSHNIDLNELDIFLDKLTGKDFIVNFTGGEPTIHPQYLDVLKKVKSRGIKIISDTNLSRTVKFYEEAGPLVDNWCISIHPSMFEWNEEKIRTLANSSYTVVYLMMDPRHWDLAVKYWEILKGIPIIKIIIVKCLSNWSGSDWVSKYTNEQQEFFNTTPSIYTFSEKEIENLKKNYTWLEDQASTITWNDNSTDMLEPDQLMKEGLHSFQGWSCSVGEEVIVINPACDISLGTCGTRHLVSWNNFTTSMFSDPIICPREYCHCGLDIKASKNKL